MFGGSREQRQIGGYTQVGPSLGADGPEITYDEAAELRAVVANEFFDATNPKTPILTIDSDKTFAARSLAPQGPTDDLNDTMIFAGAMLHHEDEELWRMKILLTRSSRMPHNKGEKKIQTRYFIGAVASNLIIATKQVKAVRDVDAGTTDLMRSSGALHRVRRAYEKNMTPADCELLHEKLGQVIRRAKVAGRR